MQVMALRMREIIEMDVEKAMKLIETWFEAENYCEQLISVELVDHPL